METKKTQKDTIAILVGWSDIDRPRPSSSPSPWSTSSTFSCWMKTVGQQPASEPPPSPYWWIGSPSPGYKLVIFKESKAEALIKILLDSVQCLVPPFCSVQLDSKTNPLQMGNENPFINFSFCAKIIHASQWMSDLMCKIWFKDFNVFQNKFWIILDNMPPNKGSLVLKEGESP